MKKGRRIYQTSPPVMLPKLLCAWPLRENLTSSIKPEVHNVLQRRQRRIKQQQQPFNGRLSGTTRVGRYQKKHSPAHTHPGQRTSFITLSQEDQATGIKNPLPKFGCVLFEICECTSTYRLTYKHVDHNTLQSCHRKTTGIIVVIPALFLSFVIHAQADLRQQHVHKQIHSLTH